MSSRHVTALLFITVIVGVIALQCTYQPTMTDDGWDPNVELIGVGCDPDGRAPCDNSFFYCENTAHNSKRCEGADPSVPDGGDWECRQEGDILICEGDHMYDGGDWDCIEYDDGEVICRRHASYPQGGADGTWNCYYDEDEFRICIFTEGSGGEADGDADADSDTIGDDGGSECPSGVEIPTDEWCGDGIDNDCDGTIDEDCTEGGSDCVCIPGAVRYCDTPEYCLWGRQYCDESGMSWGPCIEIADVPETCLNIDEWYSPSGEACCIELDLCCQDFWDLDHDGDTWESLGNCVDIVCE